MKKFFIAAVFLTSLVFLPLFSQVVVRHVEKGEEAWRYIIRARQNLDSGEYSAAIENAELAKASQKQNADWELYLLQNTQKKKKIRKAGDNLLEVLAAMKELGLNDAAAVIDRQLEERGEDYFNGSFSVLMEKEEYFSHCPEADYIIARVYQLEGEFDLSLRYMNLAYEYSDNLIVPAQKYEILYALADLAHDLDSEDDYEKYLLSVLKDNKSYTDRHFMDAFTAFVKNDSPEAVEKFFLLYRNRDYDSIKALSKLSRYYLAKGEKEKALECSALGSITIVTKIEETLKDRIIDYNYTTFEDLLIKSARYEDIVVWGSKNCIWETLYSFADISAAQGRINFSSRLFTLLAGCLGDNFWRKMAARRVNMNVD
ncbi:hypothetical protein [Treponema sp.]|uniref:tetratricopeptide repeat protein n=1 Tax=Treponema sp. TaxID=166 RepID=UPI0025F9C70F|nr:hypothetical protein [Treponema sp.]MCR5217223.1 hypothetical protein [Treponema sp.]